ncbi:MAG: hypothetical protein K1Y02_26360 [Candidatus Hydrogenedentes bacterium]|jgi:heme-degrading monooxygenase HmoA|nr:hypothetical protein [Candidatus Hydrogenedentota bacterium]HNV26972.1 hypothetical protein [Nitrospira sp.]HRC43290.1 hypothetical protein [Nitrospira sp.]
MAVTLRYVFSIPTAKEGEFTKWLHEEKASLNEQPGLIGGKVYKSIQADSKFNFINVAIWESEEQYRQAYEKHVPRAKARLVELGAEITRGSYQVALEY